MRITESESGRAFQPPAAAERAARIDGRRPATQPRGLLAFITDNSMEFLATLLTGIAWHVAVVWIASLFKGEYGCCYTQGLSLNTKDVEARSEIGRAEAEAKVTAIEQSTYPPYFCREKYPLRFSRGVT